MKEFKTGKFGNVTETAGLSKYDDLAGFQGNRKTFIIGYHHYHHA